MIKEFLLNYRRRNKAIVQAHLIINDVLISEHGKVFGGDIARERLGRIGISGERLTNLQRQIHEDPRGMRESLEKNLFGE